MLQNNQLICLIDKVKKRDDKSFSLLISEFKYLIFSVYSKYRGWFYLPKQDLLANIISCFWEVLIEYDIRKTEEENVRHYISVALFQKVYNLLITFYSHREIYTDKILGEVKKENIRYFVDDLLSYLSKNFDELSCNIFRDYYVDGLSQKEISERYNISQSFISLSLKKMKSFLREKFYDNIQFLL